MNACVALAAMPGMSCGQVSDRRLRRPEPRRLAGEERPVVALALALAQEIAPCAAVNLADARRNGNEAVLPLVDVGIGLQPFVARAHAIERDQNHGQVIGEKEREFHAPLSRPRERPLEAVPSRGASSRSDGRGRLRRSHEFLQFASRCYRNRFGMQSDFDRKRFLRVRFWPAAA